MKLSAAIAGAAVAATMLMSASAANATLVITETYDGYFDAAFLHVNNTGAALANITITGGYAGNSFSGPIGAGATVDFYLGDNEYDFPGSQGTATITAGSHSGNFTDVIGDPDFTVGPQALGTLAVPEPASWAMLIGGFGILGSAMRVARRKAVAA